MTAAPPDSSNGTETRWRCDVLIVGAGPAGTAAGIEAARAGLDTVIVDKARFPRDKCCGDGLTASALRQLEGLGLDPSGLPSWTRVSDICVRGPGGRSTRFPLPARGTYAAVCRRSELDASMVDVARCAGATVLEGHELLAVSQTASTVRVETRDEVASTSFESRWLIAADGMWSPTRKLLGLADAGYRGEWHAFRQYFHGVTGPAANDLIVWFEPDLLPGYAWSFPLAGGCANVGFGIQRGRGMPVQAMKRRWEQLLAAPHVTAALGAVAQPESPHRAWPIPARLGRAPLTNGRVLFAGDAAAATDPMTGEGIGQALETGRGAVAAIASASASTTAQTDEAEAAAAHYRKALERGMIRDHRLAERLTSVLARRWSASLAIATVSATGWTRRNFARWLFEDYPRAALATPARWRRGLFPPNGAFNTFPPSVARDLTG